MKPASRTCRIMIGLIVGLIFAGCVLDDAWAQRGGRRRRRGGGRSRARLARQSPFADLPWEAQVLLEAHRQTFRRLPLPLRVYIRTRLKAWEGFFPFEKNLFESFFDRVEKTPREKRRTELRNAFQDVMPQSPRGRRAAPPEEILDPERMDRIGAAFERYVLADRMFPTALIAVVFSATAPPTGESPLPGALISQGALLKTVAFNGPPKAWISEFLTGCKDAVKGKNLRYPSLFEYHNKGLKDRTRSFAFYPADAPPVASKQKGFGKKCAPPVVCAADFRQAAETIRSRLEVAWKEGRSKQYINVMVKGKLTPKALKIDKAVKGKALSRLLASTLLASDENLNLGNAFLQSLSFACLQKAQPDLLLVQLTADGTPGAGRFLQNVWSVLQNRFRYKGRAILAVLDQSAGQVLLLGPGIPVGQVVPDPHNLADLSATLSKLAGIEATMSQGAPIDLFAGR